MEILKLISKLCSKGFIKEASEIIELLDSILMKDDGNIQEISKNVVGLREDGTYENMNQGYTLEPFWSDYGKLD